MPKLPTMTHQELDFIEALLERSGAETWEEERTRRTYDPTMDDNPRWVRIFAFGDTHTVEAGPSDFESYDTSAQPDAETEALVEYLTHAPTIIRRLVAYARLYTKE